MPANETALRRFLQAHYTSAAMRRLARALPDGDAITGELPGPLASKATVADHLVLQLRQRGAIDPALFARLLADRPRLHQDITALAEAAGVSAAQLSAASDAALLDSEARLVPGSRLTWTDLPDLAVAHVVTRDTHDLLRPLERLAPPRPGAPVLVWAELADARDIPAAPRPRPEGGRLVIAAAVPLDPAIASDLLTAAETTMSAGFLAFDRRRDHLRLASLIGLDSALAGKPPVTALVLLCGVRPEGLVFETADDRVAVSPDHLASTLAHFAPHLRLVVLLPLGEATATTRLRLLDAAAALHRGGLPAIVAPPRALPPAVLPDALRALLSALLGDVGAPPGRLLDAVVALRARLAVHGLADAVRLYARAADPDLHPFVVCPYRGLEVFRSDDQRFFFARAAAELDLCVRLDRLARAGKPRLLLVIGPSGSGKSSLVRAGVVARLRGTRGQPGDPLRERTWTALEWIPGTDPAENLAAALTDAVDGQRLVIVDQFEKLCAPGADHLDLLTDLVQRAAGDTRVWCILTLRDDHIEPASRLLVAGERFSRFLGDPDHHVLLMPPHEREVLRAAIEQPAALAHLALADGLCTALLDDLHREPGALPLLQYVLTQLWAHRDGDTLTHEGYTLIGRRAAIATQAEKIYRSLTTAEQLDARQMLLALVDTHGDRPTRRTMPREDLKASLERPEALDTLLEKFIAARLLTIRRPAQTDLVEVAHEALIREWTELEGWVAAEKKLRPPRALLTRWLEETRDTLFNQNQVATSRALLAELGAGLRPSLRTAVQAKIDESERHAHNQRTRWRRVTYAFAAAALVAIGLAVWAALATLAADAATRTANAALADTRQSNLRLRDTLLVNIAGDALEEGSIALAMQLLREVDAGQRVHQVPGWGARVSDALYASSAPSVLLPVGATVAWVALSSDAARAYTESPDGTMTIWDVASRRPLHTTHAAPATELRVRFSEDGSVVVREWKDERREWSVDTGAVLRVQDRDELGLMRYSPDLTRLVTGAPDGQAHLWDAATGVEIAVLDGHRGRVEPVVYSPDGTRLTTAAGRVWDARTGALLTTLARPGGGFGHPYDRRNDPSSLTFSPDGAHVVGGTHRGALRSWDARTGQLVFELDGDEDPVDRITFTADGETVVLGARSGQLSARRSRDGELVTQRLFAANAPIQTFSAGAHVLVTDRSVGYLWDLSADPATSPESIIYSPVMSPDRTRALAANWDQLLVWTTETNRTRHIEVRSTGSHELAVSRDGRRALRPAPTDGQLLLHDVDDGRVLREFPVSGKLTAFALGPDGTRLMIADDALTLRSADARGPAIELLARPVGLRRLAFTATAAQAWFADGRVLEWDARTGKPSRRLDRVRPPRVWAHSRDGERVFLATAAPTASAVDTASGRTVRVATAVGESIVEAAFNADGTRIATLSRERGVRVWDATTGSPVADDEPAQDPSSSSTHYDLRAPVLGQRHDQALRDDGRWYELQRPGSVRRQAMKRHISADEAIVAEVYGNKLVPAVRGKRGELSYTGVLTGHSGDIHPTAVAFDSAGTHVGTGSTDGTARVWNLVTGAAANTLNGHSGSVTAVAFAADGRRIITGSADRTARIWDLEANKHALTRSLRHPDLLRFSRDGARFVATKEDDLRVHDTASGREIARLRAPKPVKAVEFSPDDRRLLVLSTGQISLFDIADEVVLKELPGARNHRATYSPDGRWLVTSAGDSTVVRDLDGDPVHPPASGALGEHHAIVSTADSLRLLTRSAKAVTLWDAPTGAKLREFARIETRIVHTKPKIPEFPRDEIREAYLAADGASVLLTGGVHQVNLVEVASGARLRAEQTHRMPEGSPVRLSADGGRALVATAAMIEVWDTRSGASLRHIPLPEDLATIALSADGSRVGLGTSVGELSVWDVASVHDPVVLSGERAQLGALVFTADNRRVAAFSPNTLRIWDIAAGTALATHGSRLPWRMRLQTSPDDAWVLGTSEIPELPEAAPATWVWWSVGGASELPLRMMWSAAPACPSVADVRIKRLGQDARTAADADARCKRMLACLATTDTDFDTCLAQLHAPAP